jgi:glutamine---fructose-6-phosphate transaminase (isomerizing)
MSLYSEIYEQPACLANLLQQRRQIEEIGRAIQDRPIPFVFLAARGTSDNAGRYAKYLWGVHNGLPLALAAPSLFTYYNSPPRLKGALVVGISQSGQSPDIVSVLAEGRRQGCLTLAITNTPGSPLAAEADYVIDLQVGAERAVAATKTYTAELMAVAMLSAALANSEQAWRELEQAPEWAEQALENEAHISCLAERYRTMSRCVVLGRGYNYATAYEWALKLKELAYIEAQPYSPADFQHGPVAILEQGFPVLAAAPQGEMLASQLSLLEALARDQRVELVVLSNDPAALKLSQAALPLPAGIPEWLSPLAAIIPAQLFCLHLTRARGFDTEKPRNIHKVTETR